MTKSAAKGTLLPFVRREPVPREPVPREPSDRELLAACGRGEQLALAKLFDLHSSSVYRFIARIACTSGPDIEDLVQCTFIEVWKCANRFDVEREPRSWIFGIAANIAKRHIRSESRRLRAMGALLWRPKPEVKRPDDEFAREQMTQRLTEALRDLPFDLRVAFVLCDVEGMRGVDAADGLGVRHGTLWRRLHQARKTLREELAAVYGH